MMAGMTGSSGLRCVPRRRGQMTVVQCVVLRRRMTSATRSSPAPQAHPRYFTGRANPDRWFRGTNELTGRCDSNHVAVSFHPQIQGLQNHIQRLIPGDIAKFQGDFPFDFVRDDDVQPGLRDLPGGRRPRRLLREARQPRPRGPLRAHVRSDPAHPGLRQHSRRRLQEGRQPRDRQHRLGLQSLAATPRTKETP